MKSKLKISCWNTEWASPKSKRGRFFRDKFDSDVICVTEGYEALLPDNGYVISSDEDYGYKTIKGRRKVILWSKNQWTEIDNFGSKEMPTGRFISGITMGIRFIGICIPWRFAHVSTGRKDPSGEFLKGSFDAIVIVSPSYTIITFPYLIGDV